VPRAGRQHASKGRPDRIKEELRLCLDFLNDPAEDPDSEEEKYELLQQQQQQLQQEEARAGPGHVGQHAHYMDTTSSYSSNYDPNSPCPDYSETDDFAEDEASYAGRLLQRGRAGRQCVGPGPRSLHA
jgi:hypothetical protein